MAVRAAQVTVNGHRNTVVSYGVFNTERASPVKHAAPLRERQVVHTLTLKDVRPRSHLPHDLIRQTLADKLIACQLHEG